MLRQLRLENFKSWQDTDEIALSPITGFFGTNSSGKSSLLQALLLMKQTEDSPDRGIGLHFGDEKTLVDLGDFESVIHRHETERNLKISLGWDAKREFETSHQYLNGGVTEGDALGVEMEIGETSCDSRRSLRLEEISYSIANGQKFGLRRLPSQGGYALFPFDSTYESTMPPVKFHHMPYWATRDPEIEHLFIDFQYGLSLFLRRLYYLGPLRANPHRIYSWSGAQPPDMGPAGEFAVDAILSSGQQGDGVWVGPSELVAIDEYIARWLKRLGLVYDFRIEPLPEGRRMFEVRVRKSADSAEVLLADVGFGVSQILPVLVLCFYVPMESTVILDHPDIHLHPSAQAGLADVFIDAWKKHRIQILFESHSEHLLRRLQRRIAEEKIERDDVGLFFCSTNGEGSSTVDRLELDQSGNISNWPTDFFGDQFGEIAAMSEAASARQRGSE